MAQSSISQTNTQVRASYVVSILAGLALFKGVQLLLQAAALPLETVAAKLINSILSRGWHVVSLLSEPRYPLLMVGERAFAGLIFVGIGLWAGKHPTRRSSN